MTTTPEETAAQIIEMRDPDGNYLTGRALRDVIATALCEHAAASAASMREQIINLITGRYEEFFSGDADLGLFVQMARALPLEPPQ